MKIYVNNKKTSVDLSKYALKEDLHNHNNKSVLDQINENKINQWNNALKQEALESYVVKTAYNAKITELLNMIESLNTRIKVLESNTPEENIPCTSITISQNELNFNELNTTYRLIATVEPSNTTDTITWQSSSNAIASVSNGVVTSVGQGTCTIIARCGSVSASCYVTVVIEEPEDPIEILIDEITIQVGGTYDATRLYELQAGYNVQYKYSSIIAIEGEHTIVGKEVGITTLEIICGQIIKTVTVNVVAKATEDLGEGILLYKAGTEYNTTEFRNLCKTNSLLENALCYDLNVSTPHVWFSYDGYINFGDYDRVEITAYTNQSTQQPVLGIGLTTKSGQCGHEGSSKWEGTSHSNVTLMYNVTETKYSLPINYTGSGYLLLWMNHGSSALGKVYITEIRVIPKNTEPINTYSITNNLTNVSTNNSITSIKGGQSYNATLICGNDYALSSVVVTMNGIDVTNSVYEPEETEEPEEPIIIPCTSISLNKSSLTFTSANSQTLVATKLPSNTTDTVSWKSNKTSIATVSNGIVTPKTNGECIITATCGDYSASCNVLVNIEEPVNTYSITNNLTNVSTNNSMTSIKGGQSYNAILTCGDDYDMSSVIITMNGVDVTNSVYEPEYSDDPDIPDVPDDSTLTELLLNTTENIIGGVNNTLQIKAIKIPSDAPGTITWSSSDTSIATVDSNGLVTSKAIGSCTITATCGSLKDSCSLTVNEISTVLYDFDFTNMLNDIIISDKEDKCTEFVTYPKNMYGRIYLTSKKGAVICPSKSTIMSSEESEFIIGRNGNAEIVVGFSPIDESYGSYLRKKYRLFVDVPDTTEDVPILYENPTLTIENWKAKAVKDGVTQYFDISYEPNDWHPSYVKSHPIVDSNTGSTFYVALTKKGTSPFGIDGLHIDSGGSFTEGSGGGSGRYEMQVGILYHNGFDMNMTVNNVDNSVDSALLNKTLEIFNASFPALNVTVDPTSKNEIVGGGIDDPQLLGVCWVKQGDDGDYHFYINLNIGRLTEKYGSPDANDTRWLSTPVHEFGHIFGVSDTAPHLPSLYQYGRNTGLNYFLQPNDIAWIEHMHKVMFNVDLTTSQEEISAQASMANLPIPEDGLSVMYLDYDTIDDTNADLIIEGKLSYKESMISQVGIPIEYDIFEINITNIVKGDIIDKVLIKIPSKENFKNKINPFENYRLYLLKNKDGMYSTNPYGIIELN